MASRPSTVPANTAGVRRSLSDAYPWMRLHDREFWITQGLVAIALTIVYGFDALLRGKLLPGGMHDIPAGVALVPVTYAALSFGLGGAILTSAWCAVLLIPHGILFVREDYEWLGDVGMLTVISVTGAFLAFRVDRERETRRRAESTSERLSFLSDLSSVFDRPISVPQMLQELVDRLHDNLELDYAQAQYSPAEGDQPAYFATSGECSQADPEARIVTAAATELAARAEFVARTASPWITVADGIVVALVVQGRCMGALRVSRRSRALDEDGIRTVTAAATQASISLENHELQLNRREILTSYARQVTNAQEEERRRIARELHDGPTQALTGLCRGLDLVQAELTGHEMAADTTRSLRTVAEQAVADLRRLARDLRPRVLDDLGLLSAVEWLAEDLRKRTDLDVRFASKGAIGRLSGEQELGAFRIVQEALSNVDKHAQASTVDVRIDSSVDGLRITIQDDGVGFGHSLDGGTLARSGRYGILGMQERARLNNGDLRIATTPGGGMTVTLELGWLSPDPPTV